jgi:hypothetical protein
MFKMEDIQIFDKTDSSGFIQCPLGAMIDCDGPFFMRFKVRYQKRASIAKKVAKCFNVKPDMVVDTVRKYVETVVESLPEFKSASIANMINIKLDTKFAQEKSAGFKINKDLCRRLTLKCASTRVADLKLETAAIKYADGNRVHKNNRFTAALASGHVSSP